MRRMAAGLTVVAAVLFTATGCSFVNDAGTASGIVYDDAVSEVIVQRLKATLEELPGVDDSTVDFDAFGETGREASAEISAKTATAQQLVAITEAVREAFGNPDLGVTEPIATITARDESILTMAAFTMSRDDLAADVAYWSDIRDILITTLTMELRGSLDRYSRFIAQPGKGQLTATSLRDNWPAVIALDDSSTAAKTWSLPPGLYVAGSLPDQPAADLLAQVADVGPKLDGVPSSALSFFNVTADRPSVALSMTLGPPAGGIADSPDWPRVAAATRVALASGIPLRMISYVTDGGTSYSQGFVFIGPCATSSTVGDGDTDFFDALGAAGVPLPDGSGPGSCV